MDTTCLVVESKEDEGDEENEELIDLDRFLNRFVISRINCI